MNGQLPDVLHLNANVGLGGIAAQARDISGELVRRGRCSGVVLLKSEEVNSKCRTWYEQATRIIVIDAKTEHGRGIGRLVRNWLSYRKFPERIFHFHAVSHDHADWRLIVAARLAGKRVVVTFHHTITWSQRRFFALAGQWVGWHAAHRLITTTLSGQRLVCERAPTSKVVVVPCGTPPPIQQLSQATARRSLNMEESAFLITCVCRIARYKGVFDLAESVAQLSNEFPNLRVAIVGIGPDYDELVRIWGHHHAIWLAGRIAEVNTLLAASDLFVMPSHEEGFGLVFIEAAMHGVPSIAGDLPTVREVVLHGETGWLVRPGDKDELVTAIREAISKPGELKRRGTNAQQYAKKFELGCVVDQLEHLYDELEVQAGRDRFKA